jgi:ABC-type multidrug transport system fused ATPase/permease subunit
MDDVSFSIRKGDFIGIIGPSGAGKSTLCDLLLGFSVPQLGNIFMDGMPITKASFESLRNNIGYVGQRTFLFNDTVANNVAYSDTKATREDIIRACKAAHADEFIRQLPNGYDTTVGENGGQLSGGQKQRLTIARALLKNPEIFIFDEATSSLDDESETMIRQTIETLRGHKTVIIVSHRPSILQNVDRMLLVNNKQVTEVNTLEALRAFNSPFIS